MSNQAPGSTTMPHQSRTILGHPAGLFVLFFTEMWERFSYYGMRALLVLYMVNFFKWTQADASRVYKWYTALVYLTPLLGGYLADRYLGNKRAIIIGATLMAIGHFLMAFEQHFMFYAALVFLIFGNGFFKPNMSTQVGRLYPANDPRRDSAYTIFYMGINLGAFLSPLVCGWLKDNTVWGYHAGFTAAGVGMLIGLVWYLVGIRAVQELPEGVEYDGSASSPRGGGQEDDQEGYISEAKAARTASAVPTLSAAAPTIFVIVGLIAPLAAAGLYYANVINLDNAIAFGLGLGFASFTGAFVLSKVALALRDRVLAIYLVGIFVVFFWAAFEQAGNAMNIHADKTTDRYLTSESPPPSIYPEVAKEPDKSVPVWEQFTAILRERVPPAFNITSPDWFKSSRPIVAAVGALLIIALNRFRSKPGAGLRRGEKIAISVFIALVACVLLLWPLTKASIASFFNPVSTEAFQSINALAIFVLAPVFAWLWVKLPKLGVNLSIPAKVAIGVFLVGMAAALMIWSVSYENGPSNAPLTALPAGVQVDAENRVVFRDAPDLDNDKGFEAFGADAIKPEDWKVVNGGRIYFDAASGQLTMTGVLADIDRDRILRATVSPEYLAAVRDLAVKSTKEKPAGEDTPYSVSVRLDRVPPNLDLRYSGIAGSKLFFNGETQELTSTTELADKDFKAILVAGSDPVFRDAMNKLYVESAKYKVSSQWLFWFYILCTLGELCLSPVGLSMVSKLAPARFATMLMGVWLLTSFFGNFVAGLAGEYYGTIHPARYFIIVAAAMFGASAVCFVVVKKLKSMMHGVN